MKFDKNLHQKVRYEGQLYAVILEEYPDYYEGDEHYRVVLHPIGNDWIVRISNPQVRQYLEVPKGAATEVHAHVVE